MSKKALMIGALLAGALVVLFIIIFDREPAGLSPVGAGGTDAASRESQQATIGSVEDRSADESDPSGNVGGVNPIQDRWGIPAEDIRPMDADELARLNSESGSDTAPTRAGAASSEAGANSPAASLNNAARPGDRFANPPGPDESDAGFLGPPPEATDWGSTGPAPEAFDLGQPLSPPVESPAGDIGPGDLEDDTDNTPPEG